MSHGRFGRILRGKWGRKVVTRVCREYSFIKKSLISAEQHLKLYSRWGTSGTTHAQRCYAVTQRHAISETHCCTLEV